MLEKFVYEDHLGRRFSGKENGVYLNYNELRDFSWANETINSRISRFYQKVTSRKLPLVVVGKTDEQAISARNRLFDLAEGDIAALLPGKVYLGEWFTNGYITSSKKKNYLITNRYCAIDLTLTSDDPAWYREQKHVFLAEGSDTVGGSGAGADYAFDYPYDYTMAMNGRVITCESAGSNAFRLQMYGPATDPYVTVGGHTYAISGQINAGETLLIDSLTKRITLTRANGSTANWFDKRDRDSYIFEPIPSGQNIVSWIGTFGFDLTVIEKRSEPKWT